MQIEPIISFVHVDVSDALESRIRARIAHLDRLFPNLGACRVTVTRDDSHRHQGRHYHVRIHVTAPGHELEVDHQRPSHEGAEDPYVALRDAFDAMDRRVEDLARTMRGDVKTHLAPAHGRVAEIDPAAGRGRIIAADGSSLYFHRHAVLGQRFDELRVGSEVRFAQEAGEDGPQASSVAPVGRHHLADVPGQGTGDLEGPGAAPPAARAD